MDEGVKKIVVCGFGEMGKRHGLDMEELSGGKILVAGVFEPRDTMYHGGCEWLGHAPERFDSMSEMLDKVQPHGAIIASPNFTHLENLRCFDKKEIPLILEKPLDSTTDRIFDVVRFVESYRAPVVVHHGSRYAPILEKAKQIIAGEKIGKVASFRLNQTIPGNNFHNFRRTMGTGGGQLLEKATHDLDVLLHWVGTRPKRVAAICKQQVFGGDRPDDLHCRNCSDNETCMSAANRLGMKRNFKDIKLNNDLCAFAKCVDVPDNEVCLLELENSVFGTYSNSYFINAFYSRVYEIVGTEGIMQISLTSPHCKKDDDSGSGGVIEIFHNYRPYERHEFDYQDRIHYNAAPAFVAHFHELMTRGGKPYSPVDQAFAAEMIAIAAYESNSKGAFINIEDMLPDDMKTIFRKSFAENQEAKNKFFPSRKGKDFKKSFSESTVLKKEVPK